MDIHDELNDIRRRAGLHEQARLPDILYHGTSILAAIGVVQDNVLRDDLGDDGEGGDIHQGVSFTTDMNIAWGFAKQAEEFAAHSEDLPELEASSGIILVMKYADVDKFATLIPVQWDNVATEREVRSVGPVPNVLNMTTFVSNQNSLNLYQKLFHQEPEYQTGLDYLIKNAKLIGSPV